MQSNLAYLQHIYLQNTAIARLNLLRAASIQSNMMANNFPQFSQVGMNQAVRVVFPDRQPCEFPASNVTQGQQCYVTTKQPADTFVVNPAP
jgi:hypothetical protein